MEASYWLQEGNVLNESRDERWHARNSRRTVVFVWSTFRLVHCSARVEDSIFQKDRTGRLPLQTAFGLSHDLVKISAW